MTRDGRPVGMARVNGNGGAGAVNVLRLVREHVPLRIGQLVVERDRLITRLVEGGAKVTMTHPVKIEFLFTPGCCRSRAVSRPGGRGPSA